MSFFTSIKSSIGQLITNEKEHAKSKKLLTDFANECKQKNKAKKERYEKLKQIFFTQYGENQIHLYLEDKDKMFSILLKNILQAYINPNNTYFKQWIDGLKLFQHDHVSSNNIINWTFNRSALNNPIEQQLNLYEKCFAANKQDVYKLMDSLFELLKDNVPFKSKTIEDMEKLFDKANPSQLLENPTLKNMLENNQFDILYAPYNHQLNINSLENNILFPNLNEFYKNFTKFSMMQSIAADEEWGKTEYEWLKENKIFPLWDNHAGTNYIIPYFLLNLNIEYFPKEREVKYNYNYDTENYEGSEPDLKQIFKVIWNKDQDFKFGKTQWYVHQADKLENVVNQYSVYEAECLVSWDKDTLENFYHILLAKFMPILNKDNVKEQYELLLLNISYNEREEAFTQIKQIWFDICKKSSQEVFESIQVTNDDKTINKIIFI